MSNTEKQMYTQAGLGDWSDSLELTSASEALIAQSIQAHIQITQHLLQQTALLAQVADTLIEAFTNGKKVLLCGNGGSAADAQHIAAEFVGKFLLDRPALPAVVLTGNTSSLTAIGNDYSFDQVFSRQVEAFGVSGDVCIGISTSGNSRNVIEALRAAQHKGIITVALTGATGGQMKAEADYCICISSTDTPRIQEHHILVGHVLCELVEQALFGDALVAARMSDRMGASGM
jgi:D-sedoheptulose 7-phosphate isomerase